MSNPKLKAKELVDKYSAKLPFYTQKDNLLKSKECALIAVNEILENDIDFFNQLALTNRSNKTYLNSIEYWEEVKQEICDL